MVQPCYAMRDAPILNTACVAADQFINTFTRDYPQQWRASAMT
jgi:hypothetical protein